MRNNRTRRRPATVGQAWEWVGLAVLFQLSAPVLLALGGAFLVFCATTTIPATGDVWLGLIAGALVVWVGWLAVRTAVQLLQLGGRRAWRELVNLLNPEAPRSYDPESWGSVYVFTDPTGRVRYDGSSGDLDDLGKRLRAAGHSPKHALYGKVGPGWEVRVRIVDNRDQAYRLEGQAIDRRIGTAGYENRRREGRGR